MRLFMMDKLAIFSKVRYLRGIMTIDAAVHGRKECVFTWGGLAVC